MTTQPDCHPALLVELIIENIVIRSPPDEPECLARASVVCKGWHRVFDDPGFRRRYAKFHHRRPPMLGVLHNNFTGSGYDTRLAATTAFSPRNPLQYDCYVVDSRHGFVLSAFSEFPRYVKDTSLIVSDPITGIRWRVPFPRATGTDDSLFHCWNAAVLCAADGCDHLDCHGNPFLVAFVGSTSARSDLKYACVYASESGTWSRFACSKHPYAMDIQHCSALLGRDTLYFPCQRGAGVMEYNLAEQKLSCFAAPQKYHGETNYFLLATAAGDQLEFVREFSSDHRMYLWTMASDDDAAGSGAVAWAGPRVIELHDLVPRPALLNRVICFVEGTARAILLDTECRWIMADLNNSGNNVVSKLVYIRMNIDDIAFPYKSFYTPRTSLERAEGLFQKGSDAMAAENFVDAVRCLGRAHEIRAAFYGELSPACANTCYKYGLALLSKSQKEMGSNILKDVYSDLNLALKMLDNARVIVEKSPDQNVEKVKIFSALSAVSMEREDVDDSLDYCFKALAILDNLVEPDHHQIIKLNYRICSIFKLAFKAGDAIPYCSKAISLCKPRMLDLKKANGNICDNASSAEGGAEKYALEDAMKLLIGTLVKFEKKLGGLDQALSTPTPAASEATIASKKRSLGEQASSTRSLRDQKRLRP